MPLPLTAMILLAGCSGEWNSPYPVQEQGRNILYSAFSERPKHLDPVQSYSEDEAVFNAQIYEPPLQYHYLKRPYTLVPATAEEVPRPQLLDAAGRRLADDAEAGRVAYSLYEIRIRPGIRFQPHPAFARDAAGGLLYHHLKPVDLNPIHNLSDFQQQGTRELTAADYVYQIKRLAHPRLHSPIFGLMSEYIVGLRAYAALVRKAHQELLKGGRGDAYLDLDRFPLEGATVVDRYTYRVKLKGKYPQFVYWLSMPFFAPVPQEADRFFSQPGMAEKNFTLDWYPVGTGPYMLTKNNPNRQMVLERNPNFHGETYPSQGEAGDREAGLLADAGKPLPFIDRAVFSLEKEGIPYWNKFLQGYYDASGISSDSFDQAVQISSTGDIALTDKMKEKGIGLSTAVAPSSFYMGFNMLDPVVGGTSERARKLRLAISIAMDYEEYISIFANGRGIAAQGPIPPGIFGNQDDREGINPYVYDWVNGRPKRKSLETAKKLLTEAGYPDGIDQENGKPLVLNIDVTARGPDDKARLDWYRKQFGKLNLQLVVRATDYNRFQEKIRKGNAQIFNWGWNADYPDPENFLFLLHGPQSQVKSQGENSANYANPEYDRLFEKMKNMENGPNRQAIIDQMIEIVRHDAPWLWGFHPKDYRLFHSWMLNQKPNKMARNGLKYQRIDAERREQKRSEWNRPVLWPIFLILAILVVMALPAVIAFRRRERKSAL
ncbi:MAG: ABC transporter substrate-binding protein [Deltaproteobacteria bacterium]|nr:ABC transporter substrate-binding protein [Deltaproteobacteria bacterium]